MNYHERFTTAAGLDAVIHTCGFISGMYHYCGYVRVPNDHVMYGLTYNSQVPAALKEYEALVMAGNIGKLGAISVFCAAGHGEIQRIDILFDVHGSLTYARNDAPGEPETQGEWWLGFDCGHCNDSPDVQDASYVRAECESLAQQLVDCIKPIEKVA